jgi:hypothetical protein
VGLTDNVGDFKENIIGALGIINHLDSRFDKFYSERNALIGILLNDKKITESDIAAFVLQNRLNPAEGLYRLSSHTLTERKEFVSLFALLDKEVVSNRVHTMYSALSDYLCRYTFIDPKVSPDLNELLTFYFDQYKWQKVLNRINADFISQVENLAKERKYNSLRTRTEVLTAIADKDNSFLYWIDALGVEFLGYIQRLCDQKGLKLRIHIAQADLPTITSVNKGFYDDWHSDKKEKEGRLDEIKHKKSGGYNYETECLPIHLAEELSIIESVFEKIAVQLELHQVEKVIIVSDHGASRLAVIHGQEEKYDNDTNGKHGGRCSKRPEDYSPTAYDLPFATESPDGQFLVLANYGRFKGSRKANVEVHGGATLEEVVVPIIEIMLSNGDNTIEVIDPDTIFASFRRPLKFILFSKTELTCGRVVIKDMPSPYVAQKTDKNHYVIITDIKKSGKYFADVFDGDNLIGEIILDVKSETQKNNSSDNFDSMFN